MGKRRSSILIDFLLGVIISVAVLISIITFFNIKSTQKAALKSASQSTRYLTLALENNAKKSILYDDTTDFINSINSILKTEKDKIYEIDLYKLSTKDSLKILYSTSKDKTGKTLKSIGVKDTLEKSSLLEGAGEHEGLRTYDYILTIKNRNKAIGALNISLSLDYLNKASGNMLKVDIILAIISILFIVAITSLMLYKRIYKPINQLIKEVGKIREGEVTYEVDVKVNNELKSLAEEINEMKSSIWENNLEDRFANPITGLPGLIHAIEIIEDKIDNDEFFAVLSISIKNVEPYVLYYGLANGENILRFATQLIKELLIEKKIDGYSLAQMRENHYMLVTKPEVVDDIAQELLEKFDNEVFSLYREDENQGYIKFTNKNGDEIHYSMMSVTMVSVNNKIRGEINTYKDIEDRILKVEKSYYDTKEGSVYIPYDEYLKTDNVSTKKENELAEDITEEPKEKTEEDLETDDLLEGLEDLGGDFE
ncbi:HAMP domain-containing protein [Haliovirga abyssi]|uniref:HAMP domain-containing protein n=1 Tax=Haliovirga abyssi TaxID=2996794 RepID=A0AAU9D1Y1_9FUSO|nr:HAMP domain-containing protein [Haliovirga abyssi]BDU50006.1 hypothetical protein HLVA_05750 [Haliovirga abyssi]